MAGAPISLTETLRNLSPAVASQLNNQIKYMQFIKKDGWYFVKTKNEVKITRSLARATTFLGFKAQ